LKRETVEALRAINRRFYQERAVEFSRTREGPWRGWGEILARAGSLLPERPRILDVGCGNGRLARFLEERLGREFDYCGIDESPLAIAEARKRVPESSARVFLECDFLDEPLPEGEFDWIALFGVLHHVPSRELRLGLLQRLSERLSPGGLLTFAAWRFDRDPRLRNKIVPWDRIQGIDVDLGDLEPGDHLLTWGRAPAAHRYCHAMGRDEEERMREALPLDLFLRFEVEREPNEYFVWVQRRRSRASGAC
jgi:SAM-dependent methyltransferase